MKFRYLFLKFLPILLLVSCLSGKNAICNAFILYSDTIRVRPDFEKNFNACNVDGSIAIFDNNKQQWILSDTIEIKKETLPASTFKIINLLIALETKTVADENEIVKWKGNTDTIKYGYRPEIYHDMSVKEAFDVSAGWVFIELAQRIGKKNYKKYLSLCDYGNLDLSQKDDDFWNFGAFAISPISQVKFIKKLYDEKLPFSKRNIEIVKRVMITEQNENYTIHSKTGWTRDNGVNIGWWVGYLEIKNDVYFFATRLFQDRKLKSGNFGSCRKEITKSIFKDLSLLE
jgi:beta-lactamase class D